jgi:hypothetical protein
MQKTAYALILSFFLAMSLSAADPQLLNMVMPDAKIVAGINVDTARNSPFGTFLLRQAADGNAELQKFVSASGFNPQTDLSEILMATPGGSAGPSDVGTAVAGAATAAGMASRGLIVARGNFNVEKISKLAKTEGKQNIRTYNGATLISDPNSIKASAMAIIGTNYAVMGDLATVKAALDRRNQPSTLDPQITLKVNALSNSQDAWAVSIAPLSSLNSGPASDPTIQGALNGDLFKKITETSGGIKFGANVQLSTEMVAMDEKNATALGDVVRFLVGMATMNSGGAKGAPPVLMTVLQGMTIQTQGNVVNVTVSAPEDQIESLINSMQPAKPGGAKI